MLLLENNMKEKQFWLKNVEKINNQVSYNSYLHLIFNRINFMTQNFITVLQWEPNIDLIYLFPNLERLDFIKIIVIFRPKRKQ